MSYLVFFDGISWRSDVIRLFSKTSFTHIGIVIYDNNGEAYISETVADPRGTIDIFGKISGGIRLLRLKDVLYKHLYNRAVAVPIKHLPKNFSNIIYELTIKHYGKEFSLGLLDGIRLLTKVNLTSEGLDSFYCAKWIAFLFLQMNLIPKDVSMELYSVDDIYNLDILDRTNAIEMEL